MRRPFAVLLVLFLLAQAAPALATAPVGGLDDCESIRTKEQFGVYDETPYAICTTGPYQMMKDPEIVTRESCSSGVVELLDACRYFGGYVNAYLVTSLYLTGFKESGEFDDLREANVGTLAYGDYLLAHLIVIGNGNKAQAAGLAKISAFSSLLGKECTSTPSQDCNDRLAKLNAALKVFGELTKVQQDFGRAYIEAVSASGDSGKSSEQQIVLLETAVKKGEEMINVFRVNFPSFAETLNTLTAAGVVAAPSAASELKLDPRAQGTVLTLPLPLSSITFPQLIGRIVNSLLGVVGAIALLLFIWGGIQWMTAAGDQARIGKAKGTITWATIGLFAIFGSYVILKLIIDALR